jgi:hypothetical protein
MIKRSIWLSATMVVACAAVTAFPALAEDVRAMRGRASEVVVEASGGPIVVHLVAEGAGVATHLGKYTRRAEGDLNLVTGEVSGEVRFFAANGDELVAILDGQVTGPGKIEGTYTFDGGTGRFADAEGEAGFTALTPDLVHFEVVFEGNISY